MTAQAGAVAACPFCGEPLKTVSVSEGSTFRWRKVDGCCADGPEVRHNTTADDQVTAELESTRKAIAAWNERPTPPAAVPVEALEGLALAWEAEAHSDRLNSGHCAYALRQLIKERSNG